METIRTPIKATQFLTALSETGSVTLACEVAQIARNSAYLWRKADADFRAKWDEAAEFAGDLLEAEAFRRAHDGYDKPVFQAGQLVGTIREYSDTLTVFLLKGMKRSKYGDKLETTAKQDLEGMDIEQLKAKAAELAKQLGIS